MSALSRPFRRAAAAAASLTGRRFGLLVASSLVATSAIVAGAITNPSGPVGPLAALLGRSMASERTPVETSPAPETSQSGAPPQRPSRSFGDGSSGPTGGPPASPAPISAPEAGGPEPAPKQPESPTSTTPSPPEAGRVKHVFVISLASPGYEASFGAESAAQMPYLSGVLRPTGDLLSKFSLLSEAALPNALAAIGGQAPTPTTRENCPEFDCLLPAQSTSLADQLAVGRFTWHAYMEDMADETGKPHSCVYPGPGETSAAAPGGYAVWQNPFAYFHSLLDLGECALNDVPLDELPAALKKAEKTPNFSFIAPDLCDAGLSGQCGSEAALSGAAAADAFLAEWVPRIVGSPAFKEDGLLIVTFNQLDPAAPPPAAAAARLQVGTLLVSPFAAPGGTDSAPYNPYSLLRSVEELFGLGLLGNASGANVRSFAPALLGSAGGGD